MAMTLDEYLEEIDRWKQAASDRLLALSPDERAQHYRDASAWLEAQIGHPLPKAWWIGEPDAQHASTTPAGS